MNKLNGHIIGVQVSGSLSLVTVQVTETTVLKSIVVETPDTAPYLHINGPVKLIFKETAVIIGKAGKPLTSLENSINGTIFAMEVGNLLCKLSLQTPAGELVAVISSHAAHELNLEKGMEVMAMVQINELMLSG